VEKVDEKIWHYEQAPTEPSVCPKCGEKMHHEFSAIVMTSNPPQQRWYWDCNCGYQELGGIHVYERQKDRVAI
jgi:DNA-directed RNA polymerase subunit M/transcription elongation factor TFIIS